MRTRFSQFAELVQRAQDVNLRLTLEADGKFRLVDLRTSAPTITAMELPHVQEEIVARERAKKRLRAWRGQGIKNSVDGKGSF